MSSVKTPCVGICSTVFGDEVCRGCKRFVHEVIDWNSYTDEQKLLIKERLEKLSAQVLASKLKIIDAQLFSQSIKHVEIADTLSQTMKLLELLRKASKQIHNFKEHGLEAMPGYRDYSAYELKELIDAEIHVLSTATYHTNFKNRHHLFTRQGRTSESGVESGQARTFFSDAINENEVQIQ